MEACLALGSEAALARRLDEPLSTVVNWTLGKARVPIKIYLECAEIIVATNEQNIRETQVYLDEVMRRARLKPPSK